MDEVTRSPEDKLCVKILAGTEVEIETAFGVRLQDMKKGEQVNFRFVHPLLVDEVVVIAGGSVATATLTETGKRQIDQSPGIHLCIGEVIAVDGTPVPFHTLDKMVGDTELEESERQMLMTGALFFPASPIALLYGSKRGEHSHTPPRQRYHALIYRDVTVLSTKTSATRGHIGSVAI